MNQSLQRRAAHLATRIAVDFGTQVRDQRLRRRWTLREVGERAGVSTSEVHRVETGHSAVVATYARLAIAFGLRPELALLDDRRVGPARAEDPVHAWMGDVEAARLLAHGFEVAVDAPYQHFQFAGRGDVVAWSVERRALLHLENRTRFPNLQDALGSYNAKRAYLAAAIADRLKLRGGFRSVDHALVGLWSAEVQHTLRLRVATFRATCPDGPTGFAAWWNGEARPEGTSSTFVLVDPTERPRARRWVGLEAALKTAARYRGYVDAVAAMPTRG